MLMLYEHYQGRDDKRSLTIEQSSGLVNPEYKRVPKHNTEALPYFLLQQRDDGGYDCQTHYYIGLDWLEIGKKSIYVAPKINHQSDVMINHLSMFFEALEEPENIKHLDGLCDVDFDRPMIEVEQQTDDLTIFLIAGFLQILKHIVKTGLKKQYYTEKKILRGRVKGKLNISESINHSISKQTQLDNVCSYQIFGVNHNENKLLKKACKVAERYLELYSVQLQGIHFSQLKHVINYVRPVFREVDDNIDLNIIKAVKPNPFYKTYEQALKLAQLILKRTAYNTSFQKEQLVKTPPYWIDMSKLFELYVFKKLREKYPKSGAVTYHMRSNRQELDFVVDTENMLGEKVQLVVDAKYKPRYESKNIGMDDARQLSGYARLRNIYNLFKINPVNGLYPMIDSMIIYPYQLQDHEEKLIENIPTMKYDHLGQLGVLRSDPNYVQFYKLGIQLPEI